MTYDQTERLIKAFEQMAHAQMASLNLAEAGLAIQQALANSSKALEAHLQREIP